MPLLRTIDRAIEGLAAHWLLGFNLLMAAYITLPFVAPLLLASGQETLAGGIYWFYSYACHQLPGNSWFLFGHQVAYCQRDVALYTAMFLGGLLYARRQDGRGLPFWVFSLLALPLVVDGGTAAFELRESTPVLRTLTGSLFGLAVAGFVYPLMDRALAQVNPPAERRRESEASSA